MSSQEFNNGFSPSCPPEGVQGNPSDGYYMKNATMISALAQKSSA